MRICGLGEAIADCYPDGPHPGGDTYIFTVRMKKLGADAAFLGKLAKDDYLPLFLNPLDALGIDRSRLRLEEGENGYTQITLENGNPRIRCGNQGGIIRERPLTLSEEDKLYLEGFDLVHTGRYARLDSELPALAKRGIRLSYDFSRNPDEETIRRLAPSLLYGLFSCDRLAFAEDLAGKAHALGLPFAIATAGAEGAAVCSPAGLITAPALPLKEKPVDTLGCGNAFLAGFLFSLENSGWRAERKPQDTACSVSASGCSAERLAEHIRAALRAGHLSAAACAMEPGGIGR